MTDQQQVLFEFAQTLTEKGKLNTATAAQLDRLLATYRSVTNEEIRNLVEGLEPELRREYKKIYYRFINGGYEQYHAGIKGYRIQDMKPYYRKAVEESVNNSIGLIKTQNAEFLLKMQDRFRNWATIPSNDLRGKYDDHEKIAEHLRKNVLKTPEAVKEVTNWQKVIIRDQAKKLLGSMNRITAENSGAFAFIWHTRKDIKVTGNPTGLYPKGNDKHGNHFEREGKLYLLKESFAVKAHLVAKTGDIQYDTELNDGMPSLGISCRCYAEYIYDLENIPKQYQGIITEKGYKRMEGK